MAGTMSHIMAVTTLMMSRRQYPMIQLVSTGTVLNAIAGTKGAASFLTFLA